MEKDMADNKQEKNISKLTFEQAIKQLTEITGKIELGEIPLQQNLELYEKGTELIKHCRNILEKAEEKIEKISKGKAK